MTSSPKVQCIKKQWGPRSQYITERVCDKACLPAHGSMKVTDIISQSDSQCFTPGYLSAHNLTERVQRGARSFSPFLFTPRPPHPFAVSPVHQLLECFGGGPYTSMLHRCFSMTIIFLTIASPPFCFFFPCQCRAVFGLSELFPRALIGY